MELPIAIRQLTELWGNEIVTESRILPMLGRKRCFTDFPEYREIYKSILNVGYAHRILNLLDDDNWRDELNELFNTFYSRMDYDEKDTFFVFESIAYGIGLCWDDDENIPVNLNYVDEEDEIDDDEEEFDENDFLIDNEDTDDNDIYDSEDDDYIEEDLYTITKQYHENKGVDIYVVRLTNRVDSDTFETIKKTARKYGKGYYSTFRGVNGFVFYSMDDAKEFVDNIFDNESNDSDDEKETSSPQHNPDLLSDSDIINSISPKNDKHQYGINNMELHLALRNIIDTEGKDIVNDVRLINILSDFKAFDAIPASKYILKAIIADGYSNRLVSCGKWDTSAISLCQHFVDSTGFQANYVDIIFQSLAFGLGYINSITSQGSIVPSTQNQSSTIINKSFDSSKLLLTREQLRKKSHTYLEKYKENAENYLDSIVEIIGDWKILGPEIVPSSEFDFYSNYIRFRFEIKGKITYKDKDSIVFNVVLQNEKGRVIEKTIGFLDKSNFKLPYQVKQTDCLMSFKSVGSIAKILLYWE